MTVASFSCKPLACRRRHNAGSWVKRAKYDFSILFIDHFDPTNCIEKR